MRVVPEIEIDSRPDAARMEDAKSHVLTDIETIITGRVTRENSDAYKEDKKRQRDEDDISYNSQPESAIQVTPDPLTEQIKEEMYPFKAFLNALPLCPALDWGQHVFPEVGRDKFQTWCYCPCGNKMGGRFREIFELGDRYDMKASDDDCDAGEPFTLFGLMQHLRHFKSTSRPPNLHYAAYEYLKHLHNYKEYSQQTAKPPQKAHRTRKKKKTTDAGRDNTKPPPPATTARKH